MHVFYNDLYIRFDSRKQDVINRRVSDDVVLDIGEADKIIGIEILDALISFFTFWPEKVPDYGDAIIAALCKDIRGSSVATFDRKFKAKLKKLGLSALSFDKSESAPIAK